jgi:hypothetical protein
MIYGGLAHSNERKTAIFESWIGSGMAGFFWAEFFAYSQEMLRYFRYFRDLNEAVIQNLGPDTTGTGGLVSGRRAPRCFRSERASAIPPPGHPQEQLRPPRTKVSGVRSCSRALSPHRALRLTMVVLVLDGAELDEQRGIWSHSQFDNRVRAVTARWRSSRASARDRTGGRTLVRRTKRPREFA